MNTPKDRYQWIIQALSLPAEEQVRLFPDFVPVGDELALEHEETHTAFLKPGATDLTTAQLAAIRTLDQWLQTMTDLHDLALWSTKAVATRPEWEEARRLAKKVLLEMRWPHRTPPKERGYLYISES